MDEYTMKINKDLIINKIPETPFAIEAYDKKYLVFKGYNDSELYHVVGINGIYYCSYNSSNVLKCLRDNNWKLLKSQLIIEG